MVALGRIAVAIPVAILVQSQFLSTGERCLFQRQQCHVMAVSTARLDWTRLTSEGCIYWNVNDWRTAAAAAAASH